MISLLISFMFLGKKVTAKGVTYIKVIEHVFKCIIHSFYCSTTPVHDGRRHIKLILYHVLPAARPGVQ